MKEYLMLIRENPENYENLTLQEMQDDIAKHVNWVTELIKNGNFKGGNPLDPNGKRITGTDKMITDGPYIETKEVISGFYFLLANSLEEATTISQGCPALEAGGTLEVREIIPMED